MNDLQPVRPIGYVMLNNFWGYIAVVPLPDRLRILRILHQRRAVIEAVVHYQHLFRGQIQYKAEWKDNRPRFAQPGVPPVRVDIITKVSGVSWEKADANKVAGCYGQTPVFFISRDDFIANKRATGRKKDAAYIEALGE